MSADEKKVKIVEIFHDTVRIILAITSVEQRLSISYIVLVSLTRWEANPYYRKTSFRYIAYLNSYI
jgi:hypothetical protein